MKTTIETINGKLCTVIRRPFDAEKVRESLAIGVPVLIDMTPHPEKPLEMGICKEADVKFFENCVRHEHSCFSDTLTILPALPRNPKAEDAALLYRYMSDGLYPACEMEDGEADDSVIQGFKGGFYWHCMDGIEHRNPMITHAVTADGQRVEVAIYG